MVTFFSGLLFFFKHSIYDCMNLIPHFCIWIWTCISVTKLTYFVCYLLPLFKYISLCFLYSE